jgi:hypothetical protein
MPNVLAYFVQVLRYFISIYWVIRCRLHLLFYYSSIELASSSINRYVGTVSKITPRFSSLITDDDSKEVILPNSSIISGQFVIIKDRVKIK